MSQWSDTTKPLAQDGGYNNTGGGYNSGYTNQQGAYPGASQQPYGQAYGGQQPHPATAMGFGGGSPVLGTAEGAPCTLSRQQLDAYLQQSGYGANAAMFSCYFIRPAPDAPPLCAACHKPLGAHRSQMGGGGAGMVDASIFGMTIGEARTPANLREGPQEDVAVVPVKKASITVICILGVIAVAQFAAFTASGMVSRVPMVLIGPVILMCMVVAFALFLSQTTLRFSKRGGHGGNTTSVRVQYAFNWCCASTVTVPTSSFENVRTERTNTRVNRAYLYNVLATMTLPNGTKRDVTLYGGYMLDSAQEAVNWRAYLQRAAQ